MEICSYLRVDISFTRNNADPILENIMNLLLKKVRINDPASEFHGSVVDVAIQDGKYVIPARNISGDITELEFPEGIELSPGWMDTRVFLREPGDEQKETIRSGQDAAAQGGFTAVLSMPSTQPVIQTHADIRFIKAKSEGHPVEVYPAGVLTVNGEGKELAGLYDMKIAGALAFTDVKKTITDSGVMLRALQYAGNMHSTVIGFADDPGLTNKLQTTESPFTTLLGFKGAPAIAEQISIDRDISLVKYSGMPLHISGVSTKEAVSSIRRAKAEGLKITAEVYVYHLLLDDHSLKDFDSNFKVKPPLRTSEDVLALREAVIDGTIDVICSDHSPEDPESKDVEFDYAAFGMISLESFFGVLNTAFNGELKPERLYELLVANPRKILGMAVPVIQNGSEVNFTLYHSGHSWTFTKEHLASKSSNTPFLGETFKGKTFGICNKGQWIAAR